MATSSEQKVLSSAAKSATYNMAVQVSSRIFSFIVNGFVLRFVQKEVLGVANVRLLLQYSTTVFLSREAFRRACINVSQKENVRWNQVMNVLWLQLPIGMLCGFCLAIVWIYLLESPEKSVGNYPAAVICYAFAAIFELLAEPLNIVSQSLLIVHVKFAFYCIVVPCKALITMLLVYFYPQLRLYIFCAAQIFDAVLYVLIYHSYFYYKIKQLAGKKKDGTSLSSSEKEFPFSSFAQIFPSYNKPLLNFDLLKMVWSFFKQGILKQLLTEGERYVMTISNIISFADQGIYDVISNLGSISARFIFLPIEESAYLFFTQTLSRDSFENQKNQSAETAAEVLVNLLKLVCYIGVTMITFGYSYSYLALKLYGGDTLSTGTGPNLLRWNCFYILVIAVNGVTEAFTFSLLSVTAMDRYNKLMVGMSLVFFISAWQLTKFFGSVGFILANCVNMLLRIAHSMYFIKMFFKPSKLKVFTKMMPKYYTLIAFVLALAITTKSEIVFCCEISLLNNLIHVFVGGLCLIGVLAVVCFGERDMVRFLVNLFRAKFNKNE